MEEILTITKMELITGPTHNLHKVVMSRTHPYMVITMHVVPPPYWDVGTSQLVKLPDKLFALRGYKEDINGPS